MDKLIAAISRKNKAQAEWARIQKANTPTRVIAGIRVKLKEATPGTLASEVELAALEDARKAAKCPQALYDVLLRRFGHETAFELLKSAAVPAEGDDQADTGSTLKSAVKQWKQREQIGQIFGDLAGTLKKPEKTFLGVKVKR